LRSKAAEGRKERRKREMISSTSLGLYESFLKSRVADLFSPPNPSITANY
jgi:hypothetical protein